MHPTHPRHPRHARHPSHPRHPRSTIRKSMTQRTYRPPDKFWPYVEKPEEPTAEELAALDPDLHNTLFGPRDLPFSVTLVFPPFDGPNFDKAVEKARASAEYLETGQGANRRHRARFFPGDALRLKDLFELVGPV